MYYSLKKMDTKAVIFDLDGVLCSTDEFHYRAWKMLADELEIPFDRTINDRLRGVSRAESLEIILEKSSKVYSVEEKLRFMDRKNTLYRAYLSELTPKDVSQDVEDTLFELKQAKKLLAVGSSSKNTALILERLNLRDRFDAVADGNDIVRSKPDPEVFLLAASRLGLEPRHCLVVEDAQSGIQAGKAGGFYTASVGDAARLGIGDFQLSSLHDLLEIV